MEFWNRCRIRQVSGHIERSAGHSRRFPRPFSLCPQAQCERSLLRFCVICVLKIVMSLIPKSVCPARKTLPCNNRPVAWRRQHVPTALSGRLAHIRLPHKRSVSAHSQVLRGPVNLFAAAESPPNVGGDSPAQITETVGVRDRKWIENRGVNWVLQRIFNRDRIFAL